MLDDLRDLRDFLNATLIQLAASPSLADAETRLAPTLRAVADARLWLYHAPDTWTDPETGDTLHAPAYVGALNSDAHSVTLDTHPDSHRFLNAPCADLLPLRLRDRPLGLLWWACPPVHPDRHDVTEVFRTALCTLLEHIEQREQATAVVHYTQRLWACTDLPEATDLTLRLITRLLHADGVHFSTLHPDEPGPPGTFTLPVRGRAATRSALHVTTAHPPDPSSVHLTETVLDLYVTHLEQRNAQRLLSALLDFQTKMIDRTPDDLYQPLLEEAVRLVPGSEVGSLLVLDGEHYVYRAQVGFDWAELRHVQFPQASTRELWYGLPEDAWQGGQPRILTKERILVQGVGYRVREEHTPSTLPSVQGIAANLCVPIPYAGRVFAVLNLDNSRNADAFSSDSIEAAQLFAAQAAALLHESHQRQAIEHAARTDTLTRLPNRRAFNERLAALVQAARYDSSPLSVVVMDMSGFKRINDTYGHLAGDEALIRVGRALQAQKRRADEVFRWGGDEFAVLLPHTDEHGAHEVAARITAAVEAINVHGGGLRANIGVSTGRGLELDGSELVMTADRIMYDAKEARRARGGASR
ncbi:sensor domain-containing diguanylate cyclase [Deinococcus maricopensis]|uniref:Diguanylate cyclase with GAF sensor n=1 Tax=Deinococcus maricopensis (strain DSM 21211 / LMG 22137 / NRRL B-23946 / LB-34) TaxID=709986 RepID=E8U9Q6_DEIML|nr:sensor domain-containing diguanylate cyclase [Deinococcus maricopensis]ADV67795.1 diguanylate cyclase with GAF sensor [Deinococcus maricopensis DSM 21211]